MPPSLTERFESLQMPVRFAGDNEVFCDGMRVPTILKMPAAFPPNIP